LIPAARTRLRLNLRDLAAASAFASIGLSGAVPIWVSPLFLAGLTLALLDKRILGGRTAVTVTLLAAALLLLGAQVVMGAMDAVVAACTFASVLTLTRMLAEPARVLSRLPGGSSVDHQVHLTSLLMIAGGAALSAELWFALCLAAYAFLASLSLGVGVIDGATPEGDVVPIRPALRQVSYGAMAAIVGGAIFFIAFPRLSWNLATRRAAPGLGPATTGMSDRVNLSGTGTIKTNPRVVMKVRLKPDPKLDTLEAYWLGKTFDLFDGAQWVSNRPEKKPARPTVQLAPSRAGVLYQQIELLPAYGSRTLVAMEPPVMLGNAVAQDVANGNHRTGLVESVGEEVSFVGRGIAFNYHAYSLPPGEAMEMELDEAGEARYRALPEGLDPRIAALAQQVVGTERDPRQAAEKLANHLRSTYGYTLELGGESDQPLLQFLFERRQGHCEHFATALAVMLRTLGHGSRLATGFFGGERAGDLYLLRAGDAHAWTQVWVPGEGFHSVDATPDNARAARANQLLGWALGLYEQLEELWRSKVVDYSVRDQFDLARALVRPPNNRNGSKLPPRQAWFAGAGVTFAFYVLWRWRATRRPRGKLHPVAPLGDKLLRAMREAQLQAEPSEDLEAIRQRLNREQHRHAPAVDGVVRRYLELRFGGRPLQPGEPRQLVKEIEQLRA
jgi:transglutaminase-like putative cysteine protease